MKFIKSNILIIILFLFVIVLNTFFCTFSTLDESWVFHNIYKIYSGGTMYIDNNVIDTPIFFLLGNFIFKILGCNLLVLNIYNIFIWILKYEIIYLILKKFKTNKALSILYLFLIFTFDFLLISSGANYNVLAITFALIGILIYFSYYNKKYYNALQGILIFLIFFTKQTTGIYYAFAIVLFELLDIGIKKDFFKNQLIKFLWFLAFLLPCLTFMYFKGNLYNFVDLCFGSTFEFGTSNFAISKDSYHLFIMMFITLGVSISVLKFLKLDNIIKRNIKFLLCLAIGMSFNMFPIANFFHNTLAMTFYIMLFIYILNELFFNNIVFTKKEIFVTNLASIAFIIIFAIILIVDYVLNISKLQQFNKSSIFYNSYTSEENLDIINTMTKYISDKKDDGITVLVLSYEASTYMLPLGINNGEFDLLLCGNLGYNGIQKTIDKISKMKNTEFLIFTNKEDCFYQESQEIREYIMNNYEKTGEILNYSIYTTD